MIPLLIIKFKRLNPLTEKSIFVKGVTFSGITRSHHRKICGVADNWFLVSIYVIKCVSPKKAGSVRSVNM